MRIGATSGVLGAACVERSQVSPHGHGEATAADRISIPGTRHVARGR